jgi:hypothetical protein
MSLGGDRAPVEHAARDASVVACEGEFHPRVE